MLTELSIRDVVLIERLDLRFGPGLTALTGETGAGKSILLDSLGLALGARADAGLVRPGAAQAQVSAAFSPPPGHPVEALLEAAGLPREDGVTLRRVVEPSGRSRAFINDTPCAVGTLRQVGAALVEVSGQHDQMGLADAAQHLVLLDAFGTDPSLRQRLRELHATWRAAEDALQAAEAQIRAARAEEDFLRHAVDELNRLAPAPGEEERLAQTRQALQQGERRAEAVAAAIAELSPRERRSGGPAAMLRAAARALSRLAPARGGAHGEEGAGDPDLAAAQAALAQAEDALAEAEAALEALANAAQADPRALEAAEERLFALRASARKHQVAVADLPDLQARLAARLGALDHGEQQVAACARAAAAARRSFAEIAAQVSQARAAAAARLEAAVMRELPPLKLDRAAFHVQLTALDEAQWGANGAETAAFLITTNPGQAPGPLGKIASGGELSRLMLALKLVLAAGSSVPSLVFDEVDSGIGGATAAAVGERLARLAAGLQVLVVTHSPQVAARGQAHLRVAKRVLRGRTVTEVSVLDEAERREEIARMLAGASVTDVAREAAASLLRG